MKRNALSHLSTWFSQPGRKPLVLRGARQVGKTYLVRQFAQEHHLDLIELNFEKNPEYTSLFTSNDVKAIISLLETQHNQSIEPKNSLLFLDEIQEAPELLAKLRWFAEDLPELAVIATGSLLDFVLEDHDFSMPVGRISYYHLEPLSFEEFLRAIGRDKTVDYFESYTFSQEIPQVLHEQTLEHLRNYLLIGGLPAAVQRWIDTESLFSVSQVQQDLLSSYRDDFGKYKVRINRHYLEEVFTSVPQQLGGKFVYSHVSKDIQSASLKKALDLLCQARVAHKVYCNQATGIPLAAGQKSSPFKVIFLDTGLSNALMGLKLNTFQDREFLLSNEGGMAEQLVGQLLRSLDPYFIDPSLHYWVREEKTSCAEIDYLIQQGASLIPIEVKAGKTGTLKSLHLLMGLRGWKHAVRFNTDQPSLTQVQIETSLGQQADYQLISLPLYLVGQLPRLLERSIDIE
jgi:uncharacterized protein